MKRTLQNTKTNLIKMATKLKQAAPAVTTAMILAASQGVAMAADATSLFSTILGIIGKVMVVPGVLLAIIGVAHYAEAFGDDGPAKSKAAKQIGGGIMLIAVAAVIISQASTLAGMIS